MLEGRHPSWGRLPAGAQKMEKLGNTGENGKQGDQAQDKLTGKGSSVWVGGGPPSGLVSQHWLTSTGLGTTPICDYIPFVHREGKKNKDKEQLLNQANLFSFKFCLYSDMMSFLYSGY